MYYYVYETTNNINNKKYIGQHTTESLDDRYLGSGVLLLKAIKKYGRKNFSKKILGYANNEEELNELEIKFIAEVDATHNPNYYNLSTGGETGAAGVMHTEEQKRKVSEKLKELYRTGQKVAVNKNVPLSDETKQKISAALRKRVENGTYVSPGKGKTGELNPNYGRKLTEEQKRNLSEKVKESYRLGLRDLSFYKSPERSKKISETRKRKYANNEYVIRDISGELNPMYGRLEELNPRYGVKLTDKQRKAISDKRKTLYENGTISRPTDFPKSISVKCIETGIEYKSLRKAAKDNNCQTYQIKDCCEGLRETANNLHWAYVPYVNTVPSL